MKNNLITLLIICSSVLSFAQGNEKITVYFRFNDYKLNDISRSKIDSLLHTSAFVAYRIEAHCDSVGNHAYNDNLSMQRALSVKEYLTKNNVNDSLISINPMGERFPLFTNATDQSRALNRCVELYVTPIKKLPVPKRANPSGDSILNLKNVNVGANLRLENINFEGGRHKLIPSSIPTLQQLLKTMKAYPTLEIEIHGYICCEKPGSDGLDFDTRTNDLSVNRARVVYDYLVERGIEATRLSYKGFGANNKLVEEKTEADRAINRRVEIKIVRK